MPIYMDRHDLNDSITAEHVAKIHQEDLKIEHEFGCQGLTYWFDDHRKTAFCLIKAPNKEALKEMHNKAHGAIPNSIIEVDPHVVESFLGRIEDPENKSDSQLNIIDDPAFRVLMMIDVRVISLISDVDISNLELKKFNEFIISRIEDSPGSIAGSHSTSSLVSFKTCHDALSIALDIQNEFKKRTSLSTNFSVNIGLSAGVPIGNGEGIFEEAIVNVNKLCKSVTGQIVVSSEIRDLYKNEKQASYIEKSRVRFLSPTDEEFLLSLMDFMSTSWNKANLKINDFSTALGLSKSQLYRKVMSITGVSLNVFLKEYRLQHALKSIESQKLNISETAFDCGFNSPAYFSKCFFESYGILPSTYAKSF